MLVHPFMHSTFSKTMGILIVSAIISIQWGLLVCYTGVAYEAALLDSILSVGLLAVAGFMEWFFILRVRVWQAQAGTALLVQMTCLGITFFVLSVFQMEDAETFLQGLPLRLLLTSLCWTILILWYLQPAPKEPDDLPDIEEHENRLSVQEEKIDRISVKDGIRIHIVPVDELLCVRASGDYVTLYTADGGQYVKEQTMKYFETNLPPSAFVRIHRSSIANVNYIVRMELFGKDTYQVRLKNGVALKASGSGYKLLKEKLNL